MKGRLSFIMVVIGLSLPLLTFSGCSNGNNKPPEKPIGEKLDSLDPNERMEGINEAAEKYGGGS